MSNEYLGMICPHCGQQTGIDPALMEDHKPNYCPCCNEQIFMYSIEDEDYNEKEFMPCDKCDGHDACEDFGCAYELGLGRMVKKNVPPGYDDWG